MNSIKLFCCVGMGVFVAHLGVFMLLSHLRPRPNTHIPEPNFKVRSQAVVDSSTGEMTVYREITVSTRLAEQPVTAPAPLPASPQPAPAIAR